MRRRFTELIRREAAHAESRSAERASHAKMNQLQDSGIIHELYRASRAGRADHAQRARPVLPAPGCPWVSRRTIRVFGSRGPLPRAQPGLPLRERRAAGVLHRFGRLDEAQPEQPRRDRHPRRGPGAEVESWTRSSRSTITTIAAVWDCGPDGTSTCDVRRRTQKSVATARRVDPSRARDGRRRGTRLGPFSGVGTGLVPGVWNCAVCSVGGRSPDVRRAEILTTAVFPNAPASGPDSGESKFTALDSDAPASGKSLGSSTGQGVGLVQGFGRRAGRGARTA